MSKAQSQFSAVKEVVIDPAYFQTVQYWIWWVAAYQKYMKDVYGIPEMPIHLTPPLPQPLVNQSIVDFSPLIGPTKKETQVSTPYTAESLIPHTLAETHPSLTPVTNEAQSSNDSQPLQKAISTTMRDNRFEVDPIQPSSQPDLAADGMQPTGQKQKARAQLAQKDKVKVVDIQPQEKKEEKNLSLSNGTHSNEIVYTLLPFRASEHTQPQKLKRRIAPTLAAESMNETEEILSTIWQKVLNQKSIGLYDNFFELGGHSLLAVQLFHQIAEATGQKLPLHTLTLAPTIKEMAVSLESLATNPNFEDVYLVPINIGKERRPLFLVPPAGGTSLSFENLSHYVADDQPLYAFNPIDVEYQNESDQFLTIDQIASHYIKEMQAVQPTGPYRLGGMCFGAYTALEIAKQLKENGQKVEIVIALDALEPHNGPDWIRKPQKKQVRNLWYYINRVFHHRRTYGSFIYATRRKFSKWRYTEDLSEFKRLRKIQNRAFKRYQADFTASKILLFLSKEVFDHNPEALERWTQLSQGNIETAVIPGSTHYGLLFENRKHLRQLAQMIDYKLKSLDVATGG